MNALDQLKSNGFAVLPSVYTDEECIQLRAYIDDANAGLGQRQSDGWGLEVFPLLALSPGMAPLFIKPIAYDLLKTALKDAPRLMGAAARITNAGNETFLNWHFHLSHEADGRWAEDLPVPDDRRLIYAVYVDGTSPEVGQLLTYPRPWNGPVVTGGKPDERWDDEVAVTAPPGSVVIWDTAVFHAAVRGSIQTPRRMFGGMMQGWSCPVSTQDLERLNACVPQEALDAPLVRKMVTG